MQSHKTVVFLLVCAAILVGVVGALRAEPDATHGEKLFEECAACHSVAAGENGVGPSLHAIINRKAGSLDDFRYSQAMQKSDITWTAETIDMFITDPQKLVPANRMAYSGMTDANDRADLISYLESATK